MKKLITVSAILIFFALGCAKILIDRGVKAIVVACNTVSAVALDALRVELDVPRLERAIGVVYRPETELASHYFNARLPEQLRDWNNRSRRAV